MPFIPGDEGTGGPTDGTFSGRGGYGAGYAATWPPRQRRVSGLVVFVGRLLMIGALLVFLSAVGIGITGGGISEHATSTQQFPIGSNATIAIANTAGSVHIAVGATDQIIVQTDTEVRHISRGLAHQALAGAAPRITQTNGVVNIASPDDHEWDGALHRSASINVVVPANVALTLEQRAGSMDVSGVSGKIVATIFGGILDLDDVQLANGSAIRVRAGSVRLDGELLPEAAVTVDVIAGNAHLILPSTTDARLDASATSGNINVDGWATTVTSTTPNGRKDSPNAIATGTLSSNPTPKGLLTVRVSAGNAQLSEKGGLRPIPTIPAVPTIPPIPNRPSR